MHRPRDQELAEKTKTTEHFHSLTTPDVPKNRLHFATRIAWIAFNELGACHEWNTNLIAANYKLLKNAVEPVPIPGCNTNEYVSCVWKSRETKWWGSECIKTLGMAVEIQISLARLKTEVVNNFKPALVELFARTRLQTLMHETDRAAVHTPLKYAVC